jgi:hypothetical protein
MTATISSTAIGLTEVQLLRVGGDDGETKALAAEPGFLTASLHVSNVATLIDVMVTDPARQEATLDFNTANAPTACTSGSGSRAEP